MKLYGNKNFKYGNCMIRSFGQPGKFYDGYAGIKSKLRKKVIWAYLNHCLDNSSQKKKFQIVSKNEVDSALFLLPCEKQIELH